MLRTPYWKRYMPENPPVANAHYLLNTKTGQDWYVFIKEMETANYQEQQHWFLTVNDEDLATHAYQDLSLFFPENHRVVEVDALPDDWETSFYEWTEADGFVRVAGKNSRKLEDENAYTLKYKLGNAGVALAHAMQRDDKDGAVALVKYIADLKAVDINLRKINWPAFDWGSLKQ